MMRRSGHFAPRQKRVSLTAAHTTIRVGALAASLLVLSGCGAMQQNFENRLDTGAAKTDALVKQVGLTATGVPPVAGPLVTRDEGIYLGKTSVKLGQPALPPIFYEPATFDRTITSLTELAERLTLRSGIPSKVNVDAQAISSEAFQRNTGGNGAANGTANGARGLALRPATRMLALPLPPGVPGAAGNGGAASAMSNNLSPLPGGLPANQATLASGNAAGDSVFSADRNGIRITYTSGSLKGLLDTAAARFGVSWKYADGAIQFFHTDSRTFQINAVPGDSSFSATVTSGASSTGGVQSGGGGGGGGGGGSSGGSSVNANNTQNTGVTSKLSVYSGLEAAIKVMLSPYGKVLASPATGAITVVDTPDSLERVAVYIENENKALARQVVINVTVLSVSLNRGDEYGINWNLVYGSLNRTYGITNSFAGSAANPIGFSAGILGNSKFSGSSLLIEALSQQGKVRRQTTASVVTLNNQPVPVQVARQTSYLASSSTSVVAQVGTTTSLTAGTVTAGFNMSILPHVLTNGTVMLQFSTDISTLRGLRTVESNGSRIETPEMDTRNFLQRVSMKSNETLIISGFEQTDENIDRSGVGDPRLPVLGGGYKANDNKEVIVILITPITMAGAGA